MNTAGLYILMFLLFVANICSAKTFFDPKITDCGGFPILVSELKQKTLVFKVKVNQTSPWITCSITNDTTNWAEWSYIEWTTWMTPHPDHVGFYFDYPFICSLRPGETCDFKIRFSPGVAGSYSFTGNVVIERGFQNSGGAFEWARAPLQLFGYSPKSVAESPEVPSPIGPPPKVPGSPTTVPEVQPGQCQVEENGSIIRVDSLTFGEQVSIEGTPFFLVYSSLFSNSYVTSYNNINRNPSFNPEGWSLSDQHFYDLAQQRIFYGNGTSSHKNAQLIDGQNWMIIEGGDVYIFDQDGKHIETRTFLTGSTKFRFFYNPSQKLIRVENAYGLSTYFNRDGNGNLSNILSFFGVATNITTYPDGLIKTISNANSEKVELRYYPGTDLLEVFWNPLGVRTSIYYSNDGRLNYSFKEDSQWSFYQYGDQDKLIITKTSKEGKEWVYETSRSQNGEFRRREVIPSGVITETVQSADGSITNAVNALSVNVKSVPDERFPAILTRPSQITQKLARRTEKTYFKQIVTSSSSDPFQFDFIKRTISQGARTFEVLFDRNLGKTTTNSPTGITTESIIDNNENIVQTQLHSDTPINFIYDNFGRISEVNQGVRKLYEVTYNTKGFVESFKNPRNQKVYYGYDQVGRVTSESIPGLGVKNYRYNAEGKIISIAPRSRPEYLFSYNSLGLLSKQGFPSADLTPPSITSFEYDNDGELKSILRNGKFKTSYFRSNGRLNSISSADRTLFYDYFPNSSLVKSVVGNNGIKTSYDYLGGSLVGETQQDENKISKVNIIRNIDGSINSTTVASDFLIKPFVLSHEYNGDLLPTRSGEQFFTYYSGNGRLKETSLKNIRDERKYDSYGDLIEYEVFVDKDGTSTKIFSYQLSRDVFGRIISKTETISGNTNYFEYQYDNFARLVSVLRNGKITERYEYDVNGNRNFALVDGNIYVSTFDALDRIQSFGSNTYRLSNSGEIESVKRSPGISKHYGYNSIGEMTSYRNENSDLSTFKVDHLGRRVEWNLNGEIVQRFIYDGLLRPVVQYDIKKNSIKHFVYGTHLNSPDYMNIEKQFYKIIKDHLGSPRLLVDAVSGK
ncbi:hypothetical protein AZI85_17440, partial [Bdellovibrio bacteriovorus]